MNGEGNAKIEDFMKLPMNNSIIYTEILDLYNKKHNLNFTQFSDVIDAIFYLYIESYSDEPRIGGYPGNIIKSYDEMVEFIKTGYTNSEGEKFEFYYEKERYPKFMEGIQQFFTKHPDGIITFG